MVDASGLPRELVDSVAHGLAELGVPALLTAHAVGLLHRGIDAVLIYGSRARGDSIADSDLDLLALVGKPAKSTHSGSVSLSFYTKAQLASGGASLFGAHLARDGKKLWDPHGELAQIIDGFGEVDVQRLKLRAKRFAAVFGSLDVDLPKYLEGLTREARYLLRSCLYADSIAAGAPCFSVRELGVRLSDPMLADLLSSRPASDSSVEDLCECLGRLRKILGDLPVNPHGSLEALIVNEWGRDEELVAMALLALGGSNSSSDYTDVDKVLL